MFLRENIFHNHIFEICKATSSKHQYHKQLCTLTHFDAKQSKYGELSDDQLLYVYFSTFEFKQHPIFFFESTVLLLLHTQLFSLCLAKVCCHIMNMLIFFYCCHCLKSFRDRLIWEESDLIW